MSNIFQEPAHLALLSHLVCFGAIAWASKKNFRADRDSSGMALLRVLSVGVTAGMTMIVLIGSPPSWPSCMIATLAAAISVLLLRSALSAAGDKTLDVAFTSDGPDRLVTEGIYAHVRNPLYMSYLIYWAGWVALTRAHPLAIVGFVAFAGIYWLAVRQEEAFLKQRFGDLFLSYRSRTGRFLPLIPNLRRA